MTKDQLLAIAAKARAQIESAPPELLLMATWRRYLRCGTAHCIGGWMEAVSSIEVYVIIDEASRAGLMPSIHRLFHMRVGDSMPERYISIDWFDSLKPALRKKLALQALDNFIHSPDHNPDWQGVFDEAGIEPEMQP